MSDLLVRSQKKFISLTLAPSSVLLNLQEKRYQWLYWHTTGGNQQK
ncbi:MAG TPA: hypothetical protein V6D37_06855 [Candidatus Sericytochromatia bacterium]